MDERYDGLLMGILQKEGQLDAFMDVVFSFLCRRTDFYHILTEEKQNMGFPPGVASQLVMNSYKKFENMHRMRTLSTSGSNSLPENPPSSSNTKTRGNNSSKDVAPVEKKEQNVAVPPTGNESQRGNTAAKQDTSRGEGETYQAPPDIYNGGECGLYSWSQTITDVDLRVRVPPHIKNGKDVKVIIKRKRLLVKTRDEENSDYSTLIDDEFCWDVNCEESIWSYVPSDQQIHINLEKARERWWERVLSGDKDAIDVRKIDCSRPMTDLDEESQTKIEQLMYDQRQKQLGLPTSEQQNMTKMLQTAWNAEGSPFQGQAFDPSRVVMGSDGSATIK